MDRRQILFGSGQQVKADRQQQTINDKGLALRVEGSRPMDDPIQLVSQSVQAVVEARYTQAMQITEANHETQCQFMMVRLPS